MQKEIFFGDLKKYNIIAKGRRAGFSRGCAQWLIQRAYEEPLNILWVETTFGNLTRYIERYFIPMLRKFPKDSWSYNVQRSELKINNSVIDLRSADVPESIEGFGYHIIIVQEPGIVMKNRYLFRNAIVPMLLDFPESILIAGGVPKGRRWKDGLHPFYELSLKASEDPEHYSFKKYTSFDNPLLSKKDLEEMISTMDEITVNQEVLGNFVDHAEAPFFYAFNEETHVIDNYKPDPRAPIWISFDFNVSPMTAIIAQRIQADEAIIFDELVLKNSSTPELCQRINAKYNKWLGNIFVTGDASGRQRSAMAPGKTHYKIIQRELGVKDRFMMVRNKNLAHVDSRVLCNSFIQNGIFRITKNCTNTIADLIYASVDSEGGLMKTPDQGNHLTDDVRYLIDAMHPDFLKRASRLRASNE